MGERILNEIVTTLVHAAHLLCVNVAAAGPMVCMGLDWAEGRGSKLAGQVGRFLAWGSLVGLFAGIALGLVLGWLKWDEEYRDVLRLFPSKITFGIWELVFSATLVLACAAIWNWQARRESGGRSEDNGLPGTETLPARRTGARLTRAVLFLLAATNLLYHFPILFGVISNVSAGLSQPQEVVDSAAFRGLILEHAVIAKAVHFGVASIAVTGMLMAVWALWQTRRSGAALDPLRAGAWGARIALLATMLQLPIGLWVVGSLSPVVQRSLLGRDLVGCLLLVLSVMGSFLLLQQLAAAALGETTRRTLATCVGLMILIVVMMTGVLQRV